MIRRLEAQRFRNLAPLSLVLREGSTLLVGPIGAGKTSILEAVYVATTTRSFRTSRLEECVQSSAVAEEQGFWSAAEVENARRSRLEVAWSTAGGLQRSVDGERLSISEHLERQPVLAFSWQDAETWVGDPELRRRFVDRGLVAERTAALDPLSKYRRVLAHKRSLLAEARARLSDLEPWNQLFAEAAGAVQRMRAAYLDRLERALAEAIGVSALELPGVSLAYHPSPAAEAGDGHDLGRVLARLAAREIEARRPLVGPHRDAIELRFRGRSLDRVASSGERKALALLCLAAQATLLEAAERDAALLVDDADVELDRPGLRGVWKALRRAPQVLVSSNRPEVWEGLGASHRLALAEGRVVSG
ncbi:MAG TPA: DNA replication and repair protein RecF [Thermoanaerobaculia bacterium]|nr:DNA replication and repair protein RecF [Thermoanaerobaculia bacterium]